MSTDVDRPSPAISSIEDLVAVIAAGAKREDEVRVGAEHEKLPFYEDTLAPAGYDEGIRPLFRGLTRYGWTPLPDADHPVALSRGAASITLEPGGQIELSGAPFASLHEVARELEGHLVELLAVSEPLGMRCSTLGLRPRESVSTVPWMPKPRYAAMRAYLPHQGRLALDMMSLTASVQANFDFTSEADLVEKMRVAVGLSPVVAALSAHSPYAGGAWSGHRSRRYAIWREVDPDRCGLSLFVFDDDFGYRRYVEWVLDVPMIFVRRGEVYDPAGMSFRRFWRERPLGAAATIADFENHLSTLFPDVRLKRHIEVRSADACPPAFALALVALWKGILYDAEARRAALALTAGLSDAERLGMQIAAAQDGLVGHGPDWHLGELAAQVLRLARAGLMRQRRCDVLGRDESVYLEPLEELTAARETLADRWLARFGAGPLDEGALRELLVGSACQRGISALRSAASEASAG